MPIDLDPISGGGGAGHYISRADLDSKWGSANINKWADLNNNGVGGEIASTVQDAIDAAEEEIDDTFRDSIYTIPLSPANKTVKRWATSLATAEIYRARGLRDADTEDKEAGKLSGAESRTRKQMARYKSLALKGPWSRGWTHSTAPTTDPITAPLGPLVAMAPTTF